MAHTSLQVPAETKTTNALKKVLSDADPYGIQARAKKAEKKGTTLFQERKPSTGLDAVGNIASAYHGEVVEPLAGGAMYPFSQNVRDEYRKTRASGNDVMTALGTAHRATDLPSARVNVLPGQGVNLPFNMGRFDEIDLGVKGAIELAVDPGIFLPGAKGISVLGSKSTRPLVKKSLSGSAKKPLGDQVPVEPPSGSKFDAPEPEASGTPKAGAEGAPTRGSTPTIDDHIKRAQAVKDNDAPGALTQFLASIPGIKRIQSSLHPGTKLENNLHVAYIAQGAAEKSAKFQFDMPTVTILNKLKDEVTGFGKDVVRGTKKSDIAFIGTPEQKLYPFTGTFFDIAQNPSLYNLSQAQRELLQQSGDELAALFTKTKDAYKLDLGDIKPEGGSIFLSHVDAVPKAGATDNIFDSLPLPGASPITKKRFYRTGRERWASAEEGIDAGSKFNPVLNVEQIIMGHMHGAVSKMAGDAVLASKLGGLTKEAALKITGHKGLVTKRATLKALLVKLKNYDTALSIDTQKAIDDFLKSPLEDVDLEALKKSLDIRIKPGGKNRAAVLKQIEFVKADIEEIRLIFANARPEGYSLAKGGIFKYFPTEQVADIERLAEISTSKWLRFVDDLRGMAFGGDLSPATNQGLTAWFSDPVGVSKDLARMFRQNKAIWSEKAMRDDIAADIKGWTLFVNETGFNPLEGVGQEFGVGLIGKIPRIGKRWTQFNEGVYRPIMREAKAIFDTSYKAAREFGLSEEQAGAIAADDAFKIIPRVNIRRLGWSQAEGARYRAMLTSVSFLTQPAALISDATKGFLKLGAKKPISRSERFAVQRVGRIIAVTESLAVVSSVTYALKNGEDAEKAARDVLNPTHASFMSIKTPWGARIGIGGPFRSIIRAVVPKEVPGVPFPVPFAGLHRFATSKIAPAPRVAYDLLRNKDYYGQEIRSGDFPINLLEGMEYALSGVAPLTAGSTYRTLREGAGLGSASEEAMSQFAGTNYIPFDAVYDAKMRWDDDLEIYREIPSEEVKVERGGQTRLEYRDRNPEVDAKLFITGEVTVMRTRRATALAAKLIKENNVNPSDIRGIEARKEYLAMLEELGKRTKRNSVDDLIILLERSDKENKP